MNERFFVVGDIHGRQDLLIKLLSNWDKDYQLVFLGDYIDRGPDSRKVINLIKRIQSHSDVITLCGNHEELFNDFIKNPELSGMSYINGGGGSTIESLLEIDSAYKYTPDFLCKALKTSASEEVDWINDLKSYHETESYIFVHAGVDLSLKNWKDTSETDMKWIRKEFHYGKNNTGKTIVFGHTNTMDLHGSQEVWFSNCKTKIGIDTDSTGGSDGVLSSLLIDGEILTAISVSERHTSFKRLKGGR